MKDGEDLVCNLLRVDGPAKQRTLQKQTVHHPKQQ